MVELNLANADCFAPPSNNIALFVYFSAFNS